MTGTYTAKSVRHTFILMLFIILPLLVLFTPKLSHAQNTTATKPPKILLAIPNPKGFPFWARVQNFAKVVSKSLNIQLQIIPFEAPGDERFHYSKKLVKIIDQKGKPDFMISMLWYNGHTNIYNLADHYQIPLITINSSFNIQDRQQYVPRKDHKYWYGHIAPDDFQAGFNLAEHLIKSYGNKPGNLIALAGDSYSAPSLNRVAGLQKSLTNHPNIKLTKLIYTDWSSYDSKNQVLKMIDDKPINLIWTASDFVAQGAIRAFEQKKGNIQALRVGSIDWNQEGIDLIDEQKLDVSYGGHFIEAGMALILALDTLNGYDFKDELGTQIHTEMNILHKENVVKIGSVLKFSHWKNLDFKHLSKTYNNQLKRYDLNFKSLLQY